MRETKTYLEEKGWAKPRKKGRNFFDFPVDNQPDICYNTTCSADKQPHMGV